MKSAASILYKPFVNTVISIIMGFLVSSVVLFFAGYDPLQFVRIIWSSIFSRPKFLMNVVIKSSVIILTGLSATFAFKTGLFNIGAEGQYIVSTVASVIVGILFNFHPIIQVPLVILSGVLAGAILGGIIGFLKAKFGIHEVITGIMFNWIALYLCNYISNSQTFHKPESNGTYPINDSGFTMLLHKWKFSPEGRAFLKENQFLNDIILKTDFNLNFLIASLAAVLIWVVIYKTKLGYELRAVGLNSHAAMNAGINVKRSTIISMLIAGGLSGLAGALVISGTSSNSAQVLAVFENNGFNGLAVALIAGSSPLGCVFSGLVFSGLIYAGQSLQFKTGAPSEIINIMIGIIVFFVAITRILPTVVGKISGRRKQNAR